MRTTFVHEALLALDATGDERAPGGAVTSELCGSWEHPGPCPVAPHHTATARTDDGDLVVRVLFACDPGAAAAVRRGGVDALGPGELVGPDGVRTRWTVLQDASGTLRPDEQERAASLALEP